MKSLLLSALCVLLAVSSYSQTATLKSIQENRRLAQAYIEKEKYDSTYSTMGKFIKNEKFINPYDCICYSLCSYKVNDTAHFLEYLNKAIEGGIDSPAVKRNLKKLTGNDRTYLDNYLTANYETVRKAGRAKYDTALINEVGSIQYLDQFARGELGKLLAGPGFTDSNYKYFAHLQNQADSMSFVRIKRLWDAGKFPGYHNVGFYAGITIILMHIADKERYWDEIFDRIKAEVLTGNLSPDEVATIVDNHHQRKNGKLCSYYGHWVGRTSELCDCKNVDALRAQIGLDALQFENKVRSRPLPECYTTP